MLYIGNAVVCTNDISEQMRLLRPTDSSIRSIIGGAFFTTTDLLPEKSRPTPLSWQSTI